MNIRKPVDYSAMYTGLDQTLERNLPQMELYLEIGKLVNARTEKGAAVAAAEYLAVKCPDNSGFSPRNLRRMRDFFRTYETTSDILHEALLIGWTQNVVIMEADLSMDQRHWYLRAALQFRWSKAELLRQISDSAHEQTDLVVSTGTGNIDCDEPEQERQGMIVSHPFTNTGVVFFPDEQGNFTQADLLNHPTDLDRWRKRVGEQIDKAKNVSQIFMLLNKPYYLTFIKYAAPYLSEKDLGQLLSDAWIMSEFPNADRNVGTRELLALFKSVSPEYLMDQKDWQRYQSLGDPVTVYRGVASADKGNVKALSWTLDRKTAEWFAHRFGKDGTVYTAQIKKDDICAYFSGRKESEVIVNPDRLEKIMVAPRQQIRETMKMK